MLGLLEGAEGVEGVEGVVTLPVLDGALVLLPSPQDTKVAQDKTDRNKLRNLRFFSFSLIFPLGKLKVVIVSTNAYYQTQKLF